MKFEVKDIEKTKKTLKIEVPEDRVKTELDEVMGELRGTVQIKGFRTGRVPDSMIKMRFGKEIFAQIGGKLIEETYFDALEQSGLIVAGEPDFSEWEVKEDNPFTYEVTLEVVPEFEVANYEGLEVEKAELEISDEEISEGVDRVRQGQAAYEVVSDRAAQADDRVYGKLALKIDGELTPGWAGRRVEVNIGEDKFFPGSEMESKFIGASVGKTHSFELTFADDYDYYKDFAGKTASAELETTEIKVKVVPELDDELAKDLGLDSLKDLEEQIKNDITARKESQLNTDFEQKLVEQLIKQNDIEVPDKLVVSESESMLQQILYGNQSAFGDDDDRKQELVNSFKPAAEMSVKRRLILDRIAVIEKIEATEEEVDKEFENAVEQSNQDAVELKEAWEENRIFGRVKMQIARDKALKMLIEKAKPIPVSEVPEEEDATESESGEEEK